ncbi:MAG: hypothetical protein F4Y98_07515 [Chloroflexi bacterium]|nr:hypothetical protein [Chloroflexota bacterium]
MTARTVRIVPDFGELAELVEALQGSIDPAELAAELARVKLDTHTTGTDELVVTAQPTDRLRRLASAAVARDGDALAVE